MTPLIYFNCQKPEHQLSAKRDGQPGSPITFHDGRWAYCPVGAYIEHEWTELRAGRSIAELTFPLREARTP